MEYYRKNNIIHVWLPNKLFVDIEEAVKEWNAEGNTPSLKLAQAVYFANLVYYRKATRKNENDEIYVPICSEIIKNIKNSSVYMKFLVERGFLERIGYSTESNQCYGYKIGTKYWKQKVVLKELAGNASFIKKRKEQRISAMNKADITTGHLTKWLKQNPFIIDVDQAKRYTRKAYKNDIVKHNTRIILIDEINSGSFHYSRIGEDNRLHSTLVRIPRDLRKFMRYNDQPLVSIDIRNSQPFIFASLLNVIKPPKDRPLTMLHTSLKSHEPYKHISTMFDQFDQTLISSGVKRFVDSVMEGRFYEDFGEVLYNEALLNTNILGEYTFNTIDEKGYKLNRFPSLREAAKNISMLVLSGAGGNSRKYYRVFEKTYPEVFNVMQSIKNSSKEKNYFSLFLLNIEADCVLDYCTKRISDILPNIPIFTIHDCLITTEVYSKLIYDKFIKYLEDYFGQAPQLKIERWYEELDEAA